MPITNTSLFEKAYNPFLQGGIVLAASLLIMLLAKIVGATGLVDVSPGFYWQITATFMLFYAIFNSIFSLSTKDTNRYWMRSIGSYAGMAAISALAAYGFSGLSIDEAGSYRWIFMVLTFGYLVFLSIMNFMKIIVNYAEREDWQAPKRKKKKK